MILKKRLAQCLVPVSAQGTNYLVGLLWLFLPFSNTVSLTPTLGDADMGARKCKLHLYFIN